MKLGPSLVKFGFGLLGVLSSASLRAEQLNFLLGPPSIGQGGSNPVSIPPFNPLDWQFTYVNAGQREWVFSLVPGLLYGQRFQREGFYAALGGGLVLTAGGPGIGVDHAYGYQSNPVMSNYRLLIEYRQVIGFGTYGWVFPYTFRLGISLAL